MSERFRIPNCENCGEALPAYARHGRPRRFCSDRCRRAASRRRAAAGCASWAPASFEPASFEPASFDEFQPAALEAMLVGDAASTDEQVLAAVLEAQALAGLFARLARIARPQFSWRCAEIADALRAALERFDA